MMRRLIAISSALLLAACGSQHLRVAEADATPRYVDLRAEFAVATLHFPAGIYSLDTADDAGNCYRAPRKIVQHTAAGPALRDGGIYVNKRNPRKLRGYIYLAGKITHIGNLSKARYSFRD